MTRHLIALLAASLIGAPALAAQDTAPEPAPAAQDTAPEPALSESARQLLDRVDAFRQSEPWFGVPQVTPPAEGPRVIAAGESLSGDVATVNGNLEIHGTVLGNVVAYGGDVIIHPTGQVSGDAVAVLGRVRQHEGARVDGEIRAIRGSLDPAPATIAHTGAAAIRNDLGLVVGWLTVLVLIGVGVLVFASGPLDGVVETLERGFGRAFLAGLVGQVAVIPALVVLVVGLAITLLGILLIPFAVVAFVLAVAGLMMLGFLAMARVTGGALLRRPAGDTSYRGSALRALVIGILAFLLFWVVAAILAPVPVVASVVRALAFTVAWVGVTAGFGAALISRAGTRRGGPSPLRIEEAEEELSWQTPTPIGGVAAARRPAATGK